MIDTPSTAGANSVLAGASGCQTKICRACGERKPADDYYRTAADRLPSYCKACQSVRVSAYQRVHPEKRRLARTNWNTRQFELLKNAVERTCSQCKQTKPASQFHKLTRTAVHLHCKACHNKHVRERLKTDPDHRAHKNAEQRRKRQRRSEARRLSDAEYNKRWREENADYKRGRDKTYRKAHPEKVKAYNGKYNSRIRREVSAAYVRQLFWKGSAPLKAADLPVPLVESVRTHLLIKRHLKDTKPT